MTRRFFLIFLPVIAFIAGIITIFYNTDAGNNQTILQVDETHRVQEGIDFVKNEFQSIISDLIFISEHNEMLEEDISNLRASLSEMYLSFSVAKRKYDQVRFLDSSGRETVRVNFNSGVPSIVPTEKLQSKANRYYFKDTINLKKGEVYVSPFDLNVENDDIEQPMKPVIRFGTPIFDKHGEKLGIVVLNYLGNNIIQGFKTGFDDVSKPLLVNSAGYYLVALSSEDEWSFMYRNKEQRTMADDYPEEWQEIRASESGQFFTDNGLFTFTTVYPLLEGQKSSSGTTDAFASSTQARKYYWKALSFVPTELLNTMRRTILGKYLQLYAVMVFIAGAGSWRLAWAGMKRKESEQALQVSEQNFRNSLDDSPLGIRVVNSEEELIYANKSILNMYGYNSIDELRDTPTRERYTSSSYIEHTLRKATRAQGKETPDNYEISIRRKDGEVRYLSVFRKTVKWNGEERYQVIYNDITERKQMEEQLRHSQVLASLGEMTAGIAHEVGNPLASILLYSEVAMRGNASRQTRKDLKVIQSEAKRAGKLMKDLLAYSRKLKPKIRRLNLHNVIKKVLDMRQYQQKVNNISTATHLLHDPLYVRGDSSQLTQVFLNLIINAEEAIKESKGKTIKITSWIDGEWTKISIADDGTGIPEKNLSQVFHPFFTTKQIGKGVGLGLSTCYGIVTAHGGLIHVENNEMGGTTFTLELPLATIRKQGNLSQARKRLNSVIT